MRLGAMVLGGVAAALLFTAAPQEAGAQQAAGWWDWALPEVYEVRSGRQPILGPPRDTRGRGNARAGGGPPFCRNGQGHPVHGRQWCVQKGFGLGGIRDPRWDRRGWDDVVLRAPGDRRRGALNRGGLIDVLGDVVYGRLVGEGQRLGASGPLTGRWLQAPGGATVLQIRAGGVPLAELTDLNGNRRVDAVLISRR